MPQASLERAKRVGSMQASLCRAGVITLERMWQPESCGWIWATLLEVGSCDCVGSVVVVLAQIRGSSVPERSSMCHTQGAVVCLCATGESVPPNSVTVIALLSRSVTYVDVYISIVVCDIGLGGSCWRGVCCCGLAIVPMEMCLENDSMCLTNGHTCVHTVRVCSCCEKPAGCSVRAAQSLLAWLDAVAPKNSCHGAQRSGLRHLVYKQRR